MATVTLLASGAEDNDILVGSNWSSPSVTWGSAEVGLLCLANRVGSGVPPTPTVTGGWSTWTVKQEQASGTVAGIFIATGTGTKTDESITVNFNDDSNSVSRTYAIAGLTDVPAEAIGLISSSGATGSSGTATLSGTLAGATSVVVSWFNANAGTAMAADAGWTELTEPNATTPVLNSVLVTNTASDQTYATSWGSSIGYGWIIFEVLHEAGAITLVVADVTAPVGLLDAVTITQTHTLVVSEVTAPVGALDAVTITQTHTLTVSDVTASAATLDAVAITQTHNLVVSDVTAPTAQLDSVTVTQTATLAPDDVTAPVGVLDAVVITQTHRLVVSDATAAVGLLDAVVLTQTHVLVVADVTAPVGLLDAVVIEAVQDHVTAEIIGVVAREYRVGKVNADVRVGSVAKEYRTTRVRRP